MKIGSPDLRAKLRRLLRPVGDEDSSAWVVSGRVVRPQLPDQKVYEPFCRLVDGYRKKAHSNLGAFKLLVKDLLADTGHTRFPEYLNIVAWDLGPVPVCMLGECNGLPVYAIPEMRVPNQSQLFPILEQDDVNILTAIADTLTDSLQEYFSDVADLLRSAFARSKTDAPKAALEAERVLTTSVDGKFKLIFGRSRNAQTATLQKAVQERYEHSLPLFQAEAAALRAATTCLRWCLGEDVDQEHAVRHAREVLDAVDDDVQEKNKLLLSLELLSSPPRRDELSTLHDSTPQNGHWIEGLKLACRFLSEVKSLLLGHRSALFIFVSHHMNVYASEEFYRHIEAYTGKGGWDNLVVWTGYGRQQHILLAILAKIWLSDVQLLYMPNSLHTRSGEEKELKAAEDWVLEEIRYGAQIGSNFHVVAAAGSDSVRKRFLKQMEEFDWASLHSPFATEEVPDLYGRLQDHLHNRIFTTHHPERNGLTAADAELIRENVLSDLVKKRLHHLVRAMRMGTTGDHWKVVQALASKCEAPRTGPRSYTYSPMSSTEILAEILTKMQGRRQSNGRAFSLNWVRKTLRENLDSKVVTIFPNIKIKLIEHGPRVNRMKTFRFALEPLVKELPSFYGIPVAEEDLHNVILHAVRG